MKLLDKKAKIDIRPEVLLAKAEIKPVKERHLPVTPSKELGKVSPFRPPAPRVVASPSHQATHTKIIVERIHSLDLTHIK